MQRLDLAPTTPASAEPPPLPVVKVLCHRVDMHHITLRASNGERSFDTLYVNLFVQRA
jgi:hypothetical protein